MLESDPNLGRLPPVAPSGLEGRMLNSLLGHSTSHPLATLIGIAIGFALCAAVGLFR